METSNSEEVQDISTFESSEVQSTPVQSLPVNLPDIAQSAVIFSEIVVHDPEIRSQRFSSYHVYKITTTPVVVDHVYRRFSDFVWLYDTLVALYPGIFVPPPPPKKAFGAGDEKYLLGLRRPALERFLNRILTTPILAESVPFQLFISRANTFEDAQKDVKKLLSERTIPQTIASLNHYYPTVLQSDVANGDQDISALYDFLKLEDCRLSELVEQSSALASTISSSLTALNAINTSLNSVYVTERGYQSLPNPSRNDQIPENFVQWEADLKESQDAYTTNLVRHFTHELDDVKCLLALVAYREGVRTKYEKTKAKANKWSDPSAKCDTDKLRIQRENDIRNDEEEKSLLEAVTKLILFSEFQKIWAEHMYEFKSNMIQLAQSQGTYAQRAYQTWSPLASSNPEE